MPALSRSQLRARLSTTFRETNPHETFQDWVSEAMDAAKEVADLVQPGVDPSSDEIQASEVMSVASELWNRAQGRGPQAGAETQDPRLQHVVLN